MDDFSNLFVRMFNDSQRKLLYEAFGKAAIFEWSIKLFVSVLPSCLYLKSIVENTEIETPKLRNKNGKFRNLNKLTKLMFKHFLFSEKEKSHIEQARCFRNKLLHFNLMELLDKLDSDKKLCIIDLERRYKSNKTMKNKTIILSNLNALNIMVTHKQFVNKLHVIFEQAIKPIEKKAVKMNSEISRLGKIAHEKNLLP